MSRAQKENLIVGAFPVDLSSAALNGALVSMTDVELATLALIAGIGTAGDDPVITLEQAKDASGTGAKALMLKRLDYKIGTADYVNVTSITESNPAAQYSSAPIGGAQNQVVLRATVLPTDLDVNNWYSFVRLKVADVGSNAQLGAIVYTLTKVSE